MVKPLNGNWQCSRPRPCQIPILTIESSQVAVHPHGVLSLGHYLVISVIPACFTKSHMSTGYPWDPMGMCGMMQPDLGWLLIRFTVGLPMVYLFYLCLSHNLLDGAGLPSRSRESLACATTMCAQCSGLSLDSWFFLAIFRSVRIPIISIIAQRSTAIGLFLSWQCV